jgi:hypothetical protein
MDCDVLGCDAIKSRRHNTEDKNRQTLNHSHLPLNLVSQTKEWDTTYLFY